MEFISKGTLTNFFIPFWLHVLIDIWAKKRAKSDWKMTKVFDFCFDQLYNGLIQFFCFDFDFAIICAIWGGKIVCTLASSIHVEKMPQNRCRKKSGNEIFAK